MVFVKVETGKVKTDYSGMTILFEKQARISDGSVLSFERK